MIDENDGLPDVRAEAMTRPIYLGVVFDLAGILTDPDTDPDRPREESASGAGRAGLAPGALDLVVAVAIRVPIALASAAPRRQIDAVVEASGLSPHVTATVSGDEVPRGKPDPELYLEASRLLGHEPTACLAVEGSSDGIAAALAAGMTVVAFPGTAHPPTAELLGRCAAVAGSLREVEEALLSRLEETPGY